MKNTEGVICVLKPPGMTSSDAVTDVRRVFNEKHVGHTGTLDPAAAGVLPICIGRATRLFDFLVDKKKEYIAELVLGKATDTEDATGTVVEEAEVSVTEEKLTAVFPRFIGEIEQTPPIYSALSVNGVKLYKLARKGEVTEAVESKKRRITVYELELMGRTGEGRFLIRIVCSKGTYIRTLCKDIGAALGAPAYMGFLLRTASGAFTLEDAYSIDELREMKDDGTLYEAVIPMENAIAHIPRLDLDGLSAKQERLLIHGAAIPQKGEEGTPLRVFIKGEFMGVGEIRRGELRITVWLGDEAHQVKGVRIEGTVREHSHIGRTIGFPTANLEGYDKKQLPPEGVYASVAVIDGRTYPAVTSIGRNPTVGGRELSVETHMIGFSGDCYGKHLTVRFIKRLRGMIPFASLDELKKQIESDREEALKLLSGSKYTE